MFFTVPNSRYQSIDQLRANTLLNAYYLIQKYPLHASEKILDQFLQQQKNISLKDMCVRLLLNLKFYEDDFGNLVLLFKNPKYEQIARLITYGNGAIPGSKILQIALNS